MKHEKDNCRNYSFVSNMQLLYLDCLCSIQDRNGEVMENKLTRQEASNLLDNLIGMVTDNQESNYDEALKMGKEALVQEPCENCISRKAAIDAIQNKAKRLTNEDTINGLCGAVAILFDLPSVTPQEPFINKPCVSEKQCEHDKNVVLDKIRAELHATAEMHEDGDYYLRDEWIDEYFDKYKVESEG